MRRTHMLLSSVYILLFLTCLVLSTTSGDQISGHWSEEIVIEEDWLLPYRFHHGPRHSNRYVRGVQHDKYLNVTYEVAPPHRSDNTSEPVVERRQFVQAVGDYWAKTTVRGHYFRVSNPHKTVSVLEPTESHGCDLDTRESVMVTSEKRNCLAAVNAGFFNTTSGACIGNVVSDGRAVQNSGVQNANFGILKDGHLFFGYVPKDMVVGGSFSQLVSGVIWLVRRGESYVDASKKAEHSDSQESGTLDYFVSVRSGRLAVGHDKEGRIIVVQVDGKTGQRGINLHEFATLLVSLGVVNAINLDGGGSTTSVVNSVLVNIPSDICRLGSMDYTCARKVSTILCFHDLPCPRDCSGHGNCIHGNCDCHGNWVGAECAVLQCGSRNCSGHGTCTEGGCLCGRGWLGSSCQKNCPQGSYGLNCSELCQCANGSECRHTDGSCTCPPGFRGQLCQQECPYGWYGRHCRQICNCNDSCSCHHITGACNVSLQGTSLWQAGHCLAEHIVREHHVIQDIKHQYNLWLVSIISLAVIASVSVVVNISLFCLLHLRGWPSASVAAASRHLYHQSLYSGSSSDADDEMESPSGIPSKTFFAGFDPPVAVKKKTYPASHRSDRMKPSLHEDQNSCSSATGGLRKFPGSSLPSEHVPLNVSANGDTAR